MSVANLLFPAIRCVGRAKRLGYATAVLHKEARTEYMRAFSNSSLRLSTAATHSSTKPILILHSPTKQELENENIDLDTIPSENITIEITERAAEQLRHIASREENSDSALRVAVESGGCHGYQYKLELAKHRQGDDYHLTHPVIKPSNVFVDAVSLSLLNGSTIDFATELIGSSFRILNNPNAKGNGCGCGVSWELKE